MPRGSSFRSAGLTAARAAEAKKAEDVLLLHLGSCDPLSDYLMVATALSPAHLETLETEVLKAVQGEGIPCVHRARPRSDSWRVLDFGSLMVHFMTAETRAHYALEKLHAGVRRIKFEAPAPKTAAL